MEVKDTLFHINWGDGDITFIVAPDEKTAKEIMSDGKDMVNYIVRLDSLYQMIFIAGKQEGRREVVELALQAINDELEFPGDMPDELWFEINGDKLKTTLVMRNTVRLTKRGITERLQSKLKEWGLVK